MESSKKEKIAGFGYVSVLFLVLFLCCATLLFYKNTEVAVSGQKEFDIAKIERVGEFRETQKKEITIIDSIYARVKEFNPEVRANYAETEINFLLSDLRNLYASHAWDSRYKIFSQFADYCEMWLTGKKEIWSKKNNIIGFTKNLEECESGIAGKETNP